jgi:MerR family copper efflux transcriptional regulator
LKILVKLMLTPYTSTECIINLVGGIMSTSAEVRRTIGKAAKEAEIGVETIRFYERKGLIDQPERAAGFRQYSDQDIKKLRFVKKAKTLGFSLDEIKDLMELEVCSPKTKNVIKEKSQIKILEIQQKIADLEEILKSLKKFSHSCATGKKTSTKECGLLECFEHNWECCK